MPVRRSGPLALAGLDERCATHQFIRVHGRRPTPEELAACLRTRPDERSTAPGDVLGDVLGAVRRRVARLVAGP